jgi:hypothetical protein
MKTNNNLESDQDVELNNEITNNKSKSETTKKDNSTNIIDRPIQDELKNFISNLNKFHFTSAFDHRGAKSFLKSKGKALKEIDLNENILDEEESQKKHKKKKELKKNASFKAFNTNIIPEPKYNMASYKEKIKSEKNIKKIRTNNIPTNNTNTIEKSKKSKNKIKKLRSSKNNDIYLEQFINKELNTENKKAKKFRSQMELKMISDKNLCKLKPIKKRTEKSNFNKNRNQISNNNNACSFLRNDSSKTDSTLFHLVSEISKI